MITLTAPVLRPYQQMAVDGAMREFETVNSTLLVLPTGTGKTVIFADIIRRFTEHGGRAMVIGHREELIDQAKRAIERVMGECVEIEMAERWTDEGNVFRKPKVVVSSVQTQTASRGGRMDRFTPSEFKLLVIDEAHHAVADTYRQVIDHYTKDGCKVLGVTATPDRADEEALGKVFESVAFDYEILDAIRDGYLVDIVQEFVQVHGLDFSRCRTTAGDLNGADLAEVMEEEGPLQGVVHPTITIAAGRKTLVFAASVHHAELMAHIFNRHSPGCAEWVCGETPKEDRRKIFERYKRGDFQFLCNVGIATEGFDEPSIEVIAMGRPTKSRSLYAQMAGRGTRPLPGLIDGVDLAEDRRQAITGSPKPNLHIIDFVGNSGRHKLVSAADILGNEFDEDVVERSKQMMLELGAFSPYEALQDADQAIKHEEAVEREQFVNAELDKRKQLIGFAEYVKTKVDPFGIYDVQPMRERGWDKIRPPTAKQLACLDRAGIDYSQLNKTETKRLLNSFFAHGTPKQIKLLERRGHADARTWPRDRVKAKLDEYSASEGWGKR